MREGERESGAASLLQTSQVSCFFFFHECTRIFTNGEAVLVSGMGVFVSAIQVALGNVGIKLRLLRSLRRATIQCGGSASDRTGPAAPSGCEL